MKQITQFFLEGESPTLSFQKVGPSPGTLRTPQEPRDPLGPPRPLPTSGMP